MVMTGFQRRVVLCGVIFLFVSANILGPRLFTHADDDFVAIPFSIGGLVSEVCLLAIWGALGAQAVKLRMPLSLALLVVGGCSYLIGLQYIDGRLPLEVAIAIGCLSLMMYCCMQVPLWVMRAVTQRRIDLPHEATLSNDQESAQFGLRYLMTGTAALGVLLVLVKHSLPEGSLGQAIPWHEIIGGGCVFMAFCTLICLPCLWLALTDVRRSLCALCLAIVCLGGPLIVSALLVAMYGRGPNAKEAILGIFFFGVGAAGTTLLVLFVVRFLGYRLVPPPIGAQHGVGAQGKSPLDVQTV